MIYLTHKATTKIIGSFDTIALAKAYLDSIGRQDYSSYMYLKRIEDMSYISRVTYVDDVCIYNNKDFWENESHNISDDYDNHIVKDSFGEIFIKEDFDIEMNNNTMRINNVKTLADAVAYNIKVGYEFISLFREECMRVDLGDENGITIVQATSDSIPLVIIGTLNEAAYLLSLMENIVFLNPERVAKYITMLETADIIDYFK